MPPWLRDACKALKKACEPPAPAVKIGFKVKGDKL